MYECQDCGYVFNILLQSTEKHGLIFPPYEEYGKCPVCSSGFIREIKQAHCRCCGALLPEGKSEYCDDLCRRRGTALWKREALRKKKRNMNPLNITVKQIEDYNRTNGTQYTYGQFTALIAPKIKGDSKI